MAEPADINVDELRRRARRRLIGAIVLALGAAVIVPMLLESDPKPLGDDVAVKIPPVDDGKFINQLNAPQGKSEAPSNPAKDARKDTPPQTDSPAHKSVADAEKSVVAPPMKISKYDTSISPASPAPPPVAAAPAAVAPETSAAKSEAKPQSAAPPDTAMASTQSVREGFAVQLAAYSDDKGANALASRLKRSGYPAYTEPLKTSRGTLWRVRVGPYPSRDAATGVRDKLKAEGQSGIVASAR
jgi:DedD protein